MLALTLEILTSRTPERTPLTTYRLPRRSGANVDGVAHKVRYGYADYETNTLLTGSSDLLKDLVNDDLFRTEATVSGAYSYESTLGGQITVPKLEVTAITVTGSVK